MKIRLLCKNNKYQDFGNHTGFRYIETTHNFLKVGEYYDLIVDGAQYKLNVNGNDIIYGKDFHFTHIFYENSYPQHNQLYNFFYSIEEMRDIKLNKIT